MLNETRGPEEVRGHAPNIQSQHEYGSNRGITTNEVSKALKEMGRAKAVDLDNITIEVWKCLGEEGIQWLTSLFNVIWRTHIMPEEWRSSTLIPIYKNKGDAQVCGNYRGIKLLSHTMKLWERVIEKRIREEVVIKEYQFGFMPGRSTFEAIHVLRKLMEKCREKKKDLHMVFIDLEKAYDNIPRYIIWDSLEAKGVSLTHIKAIRDMYDGASTNIQTPVRITKSFLVEVGLHQGSTLSLFLFAIILNELLKSIWETVLWCMLFANDIVLVAETSEEANAKLEEWRAVLEGKGLRISRTKTEYLRCNFSGNEQHDDPEVIIGEDVVANTKKFKYLGSVIQSNGEIDENVTHRYKRVGLCGEQPLECYVIESFRLD